MTLHLAQRFRMDGETFIRLTPYNFLKTAEVLIIHARNLFV